MKLQGQSIKLFVIESLKKLKMAELSNWIGKAYIGERKHSKIIQDLPDLQNKTGIYLLLSNKNDETQLYIGESDNVANRINQHFIDNDKQWWDTFIIFVSTSSNLTKAHVLYLEKELHSLAKENLTTIKLHNNQNPQGSNLRDYDVADMDIFLENMIFVLDNLGIIDFTTVNTEKNEITQTADDIFYLNLKKNRIDKDGNILQAKLIITENGYKLLKGSFIETDTNASFIKHCLSAYNLRQKLEVEGSFDQSEYKDVLITNKDLDFKSPSAASDTVKNISTNGRKDWKLENGKTLDEFEAESV